MPTTLEAVLVAVLAILPGFLAIGGYRFGRAVPAPAEGLNAAARALTVSFGIALIAWKLGGRDVYEHARAGTALTTDEGATYRLALALLVVPAPAGFLAGQTVDAIAHLLGNARAKRSNRPAAERDARAMERLTGALLDFAATRFLSEGPTTWERTWKDVGRTHPFVFVRVRTKSGEEVIGAVARSSRIAASPQPRDVYLEQVLREADDGRLYPTAFGLGMFISGSEIELVEWVSEAGLVPAGEVSHGG